MHDLKFLVSLAQTVHSIRPDLLVNWNSNNNKINNNTNNNDMNNYNKKKDNDDNNNNIQENSDFEAEGIPLVPPDNYFSGKNNI